MTVRQYVYISSIDKKWHKVPFQNSSFYDLIIPKFKDLTYDCYLGFKSNNTLSIFSIRLIEDMSNLTFHSKQKIGISLGSFIKNERLSLY